jgi:two-component system NtrC family sensor kinase
MLIDRSDHRLSIKAKLISSYLIILGIGGLATSVLGSWIVSSTIMMQARRMVDHDLATAKTVYEQTLEALELPVKFSASGATIQRQLEARNRSGLIEYLSWIRNDAGFDFLNLTDANGRVIVRTSRPDRLLDDASTIAPVRAALSGKTAASSEILPPEALQNEDATLLPRVLFQTDRGPATLRMALVAAAPVKNPYGVIGVLYGGVLLGRNFGIVDRVWDLLFKRDRFNDVNAGSVTIIQDDLRIATNVQTAGGERALGTRVSQEVRDAVLRDGQVWRGRAFVVRQWYISEYYPIRNYDGNAIGMLAVGVVESIYTSIRNRVIFSFFCLATTGFILIIGITYYMIGNITRPLGEMVAATRSIAAGRFDREVQTDSPGEIALLANSFNTMLKSLRQMRGDLEEWGRTLEAKVQARTEELVAMQARVAQSERLASLGMLAAGVAHEVNNPLGGILALTWLTLEDMQKGDPNRENLEEVVRQTERCRDIVKGLLEFSRQSKGNFELVDMNRILRETLALIGKQAIFFNINLVEDLEPALPPVMADRSQLQQVFMNMLMNAVQAMEERGTITVKTRRNDTTHSIEVAISDTGRGIPQDQINRIFDPFFTTKASGQGTGLGLSIAYGIVTTHRGTISVRSEPEKGSTFTVCLPIAEVPEESRT